MAGHLGEWIAAQIFDITLERSAVAKGIDGRFATGPLADRTVNVKWYRKQEGLLDLLEEDGPDYYLVMTGPKGGAVSSRDRTRPLLITAVYLFNAAELLDTCRRRAVKIGVATSVRAASWDAAEIFPRRLNPALSVSEDQAAVRLRAARTGRGLNAALPSGG